MKEQPLQRFKRSAPGLAVVALAIAGGLVAISGAGRPSDVADGLRPSVALAQVVATPTSLTGMDRRLFLPVSAKDLGQGSLSPTPTSTQVAPGEATATATATATNVTGSGSGAVWLPSTADISKLLPTYGANVSVDSAGGIHAAYAIYAGTNDQGQRPAIYAYCPSSCTLLANWTYTQLGTNVHDARLLLGPADRPRLILFGPAADYQSTARMQYQYGTCDAGCTNAGNWTLTTVATPIEPVASREFQNNQYFALDPEGRPAIIYTDTTNNNHPGSFYLACTATTAAACTSLGNWTETVVNYGKAWQPSLVFAGVGRPRLAYETLPPSLSAEGTRLYYHECDTGCGDDANWTWTILSEVTTAGSQRWFSLRVDPLGRPRIAYYSGGTQDSLPPNHLYYLWCQSACTAGGSASWGTANVGLPDYSGEAVTLLLDRQDRPRLAFNTADSGLGYAWCDVNCESTTGVWQSKVVETMEALADNFEVLPIRRCTISTWFNGQRPSLALDAAGNPRIGYDAQHYWYGTEVVNGQTVNCNYKDVTVTRLAIFEKPT